MRLTELIDGFPLRLLRGGAVTALTDLTDDSRQVKAGGLFIARPGTNGHGLDYLGDVLAGKPAAILSDRPVPVDIALPAELAWVQGQRVDAGFCSRLAERFFGYPSRRLQLVAVTGTNGKTTVAFLAQHLLTAAGLRSGLLGTVLIDDGLHRRGAELTTPGPVELSRHLAAMVDHGCAAAVFEASSHALDQGRLAGLELDAAIFTNLSGDHLDYHQTMARYAAAKARLFDLLGPEGWAVVNARDAYAQTITDRFRARGVQASRHLVACGVSDDAQASSPSWAACATTATAHIRVLAADHTEARFVGPWGDWEVRLPLIGRHNVANALQALAAVWVVLDGAAENAALRQALGSLPQTPGRLERVIPGSANVTATPLPTVLVDYAHTDDALENVLSALKPLTRGRLICVFGCGGDRDRTKRPRMAAVAARHADLVHITSDNPRTEDPLAIIDEIRAGLGPQDGERVYVDPDRARTIAAAIAGATPDDVVLIAGKGHEDYQIVGRQKHHFDDREQAAAALDCYLSTKRTHTAPPTGPTHTAPGSRL